MSYKIAYLHSVKISLNSCIAKTIYFTINYELNAIYLGKVSCMDMYYTTTIYTYNSRQSTRAAQTVIHKYLHACVHAYSIRYFVFHFQALSVNIVINKKYCIPHLFTYIDALAARAMYTKKSWSLKLFFITPAVISMSSTEMVKKFYSFCRHLKFTNTLQQLVEQFGM